MPYRRFTRCPLLTTHGRVLAELIVSDGLTRAGLCDALCLADTTIQRILAELSGEGLVRHERIGTDVWWTVTISKRRLMERFLVDRALL